MDHATVMRWVAGYERAWRGGDLDAVAGLFTEDARYRRSPYHEPDVGHAGIRAIWLVDEGQPFTMTAEPVACAIAGTGRQKSGLAASTARREMAGIFSAA